MKDSDNIMIVSNYANKTGSSKNGKKILSKSRSREQLDAKDIKDFGTIYLNNITERLNGKKMKKFARTRRRLQGEHTR